MRDTPWAGPDKRIRQAFRSDRSYEIIDAHGLGDTWMAGGCVVAAEAIKRCFGGTLLGIWDAGGLQHVVVEKRGVLIDASGRPAKAAAFLRRYAKEEGLRGDVHAEPFETHQAERHGIHYEEHAIEETEALLRGETRSNPVTRAPPTVWSEAQRQAGKRVLREGKVVLERDVWEHGAVKLIIATEESQGWTWWYWVLSDGKKVVGFGSAMQGGGKLFVENSWIAKNLRGMGLYQLSLKTLRQVSGMPVASAKSRSKAAERSWKRMGARFDEAADRWEINPPPRPMSYAAAHRWEAEARRRGVSAVARSSRGFMRAYQRAGSFARLPDAWKRRREAFIARHMAQARSGRERLWSGGTPSRRGLALLMWAYYPPKGTP